VLETHPAATDEPLPREPPENLEADCNDVFFDDPSDMVATINSLRAKVDECKKESDRAQEILAEIWSGHTDPCTKPVCQQRKGHIKQLIRAMHLPFFRKDTKNPSRAAPAAKPATPDAQALAEASLRRDQTRCQLRAAREMLAEQMLALQQGWWHSTPLTRNAGSATPQCRVFFPAAVPAAGSLPRH